MGKQMLAYFFALRYIIKLYKCQKRRFCLGSITKCHVIRSSGGLQSRAKNKAPFEKLRLADFSIMGQWSCWSFVFWLLGASANSPRRFARVDGICDASLASRDCTLSTGEHKRVRNRMNSSKRFTVRYIGRLPLLA